MNSMSNEELRELIASLAVSNAEAHRQWQAEQAEIRRQWQLDQAEAYKKWQAERAESSRKVDEALQRAADEVAETGRHIRELKQQMGGLSEKFGSFTEGMAFPAMRKLLQQRFHMDVVTLRALSRKNGHFMELDVLAYSNSKINEVYVVEVKSHLRQEGLEQMKRILREFHDFFPGHEGKKVYGILAAVDIPEDLREKVLREGIYLALIHDDQFELQVPSSFQPRAF
jgi:hypothetical protein